MDCIIDATRPVKTLADELTCAILEQDTAGISKTQRLGIALTAAYATNDLRLIDQLVSYTRDNSPSSTVGLARAATSIAELNAKCDTLKDANQQNTPQEEDALPDYNSDQRFTFTTSAEYDTCLYSLAAMHVINRKLCLNLGTELIFTGSLSKTILMAIVKISVLITEISALSGHFSHKPYKVLLVDDDARITRRLKRSLGTRSNFIIESENNPFKALATARKFFPDVIVLDMFMPGKHGGEILSELQADPELKDIEVIVMTSMLTEEETGEKGKFIAGNLHLAKTTLDPILVSLIRDQLTDLEMATN